MNLPNKLTIIRILLVPLVLVIFLFPFDYFNINLPVYHLLNTTLSLQSILALLVFALASFTDYLDGKIARKEKLITTFGKFADPIADKLLINTLFIILANNGTISVIVPIIMVGRDMIVDAIRLVAISKNKVIAASNLGKLKTVSQMAAVFFLLIGNIPFSIINIRFDLIMTTIATIISLVSGFDYYWKNKDIITESM